MFLESVLYHYYCMKGGFEMTLSRNSEFQSMDLIKDVVEFRCNRELPKRYTQRTAQTLIEFGFAPVLLLKLGDASQRS